MAYQNINFPTIKLVHGLRKEIGQSTKIISNGNTEYRLSKSSPRRRWTFSARAMTKTDRDAIILFARNVNFALDSFNFYCPIEKTTYKVRFDSSSLSSVVETMDVNGNVTSVTMGDIVLVEVIGE
jgi:hypothetical protein